MAAIKYIIFLGTLASLGFAQLFDLIPDIVDVVPDLIPDLVPDLIDDLVPDLVPEIVGDIVDVVPDLVGDVGPDLIDLVPDAIPDLIEDLLDPILAPINDIIASILTPALEPIAPFIEAVLPDIFGLVTSLLTAAAIFFNAILPIWKPSADVPNGANFDFIIVGGGTAGCILANRLSEEQNSNVLLIEAGGDPSLQSALPGLFQFLTYSPEDWNYAGYFKNGTSQGQAGGKVPIHAGKHLGGSSSSSYTLYNRGREQTFVDWNLPGWSFDEVLPYYKKLEEVIIPSVTAVTGDIHGLNGSTPLTSHIGTAFEEYEQTLVDSYEELGINRVLDINDREVFGGGLSYILAQESGLRSSTAINYLLPVQDRENLSILKNTFCTKILIDENNVAIGVEVETADGQIHEYYATKEVILSTGVYRSPQLLMVSGVGPREHLEEFDIEVKVDSPNVGLNYIDLPAASLYYTGLGLPVLSVAELVDSALNLGTFPIPTQEILLILNETSNVPNIEYINLVFSPASAIFYIGCIIDFNYVAEICNSVLLQTLTDDTVNTFPILSNPKSSGRISLVSNDPRDDPYIYQGYYENEEDLDLMTDAIIKNNGLLNTTAFKDANSRVLQLDVPSCEGIEFGTYEYWRCYGEATTGSLFFASGSCRMGDAAAVLDERFRVRGVANLRVVDASSLPSQVGGLTEGLTLVSAERAADFIKTDQGIL